LKNKGLFSLIIIAISALPLPAQEALKSAEEEYYDFLSLQGIVARPTLNYRTLSDSVWKLGTGDISGTGDQGPGTGELQSESPEQKETDSENPESEQETAASSNILEQNPKSQVPSPKSPPWQSLNLGTTRALTSILTLRIYGPELFMSYNTAAPYGQNDGALWQGKGFNTSFTGGARFELGNDKFGRLQGTLKPQVSFSQNAEFAIMPREGMSSDNKYSGKAADWGYFWGVVDAPQRFGDKPFWTYDWGDTEIRYTWKTLTIGFGTQSPWLGPAYLNPILHSNNAPTYPKLDIGLRRQRVVIPKLGWYLGDVEFRIWTGQLKESAYFDNDDSNDYRMFHGLSFAYAPSFAKGLTLFANRVDIVPWAWSNLKYIIPKAKNEDVVGKISDDQKASFGFSYLLTKVGFEVFGEIGIDDYVPHGIQNGSLEGYIRYPFHTMAYTVGLKKKFNIYEKKQIYGEVIFEWNSLEMSQDFQFQWAYHWYMHNRDQGYTNKGQWLGNAASPGGNSQYLEFKVYYPKGVSSVFFHRNNPDNNFIYSKAIKNNDPEQENHYFTSWKANFIVGLTTKHFVTRGLSIFGGFMYNYIINPYYYYDENGNKYKSEWTDYFAHNFSIQAGINWQV